MMQQRFVLLSFILTLAALPAAARGYFDFNAAARTAYEQAISLRFDEARYALADLRSREPDNLVPLLIENYVDFLTVFLNDNRAEYKAVRKNFSARIDRLKTGDPHSPWYRYCQAEIRLHAAVLAGRFGNYLDALADVKRAYSLLEENDRFFPGFVANKKSLGILHALVGNVPREYQWAVRTIGGMRGTIDQGLRELDVVRASARRRGFIFAAEADVAYAFLLLHLRNQPENAWKTLNTSSLDAAGNPLAAFALANLALRTGRTDAAIALLERSPRGGPYAPFHYRDYLLGLAKLYRLDADANLPLQRFLHNFPGENGIKEAYQKLAWYHLVRGNDIGYRTYIGYAKRKGADRSEPDKAALREARDGIMPDARLTEARLLFDGGYHQRAYDLLRHAAGAYAGNSRLQLEYTYRLGRVAHALGRTAEAERCYRQTIDGGAAQPWYYACNAALQLGLMYEEKKNTGAAKAAFRQCLAIEPAEYGGSLHARAKAGLNRLKGGG